MANARLSAAAREDLSDARLMLETASHNLQAVLREQPLAEADVAQALENAERQSRQAAAAIARVRGS